MTLSPQQCVGHCSGLEHLKAMQGDYHVIYPDTLAVRVCLHYA